MNRFDKYLWSAFLLAIVIVVLAAAGPPPPLWRSWLTTNTSTGTFTNNQVPTWSAGSKTWIPGNGGSGVANTNALTNFFTVGPSGFPIGAYTSNQQIGIFSIVGENGIAMGNLEDGTLSVSLPTAASVGQILTSKAGNTVSWSNAPAGSQTNDTTKQIHSLVLDNLTNNWQNTLTNITYGPGVTGAVVNGTLWLTNLWSTNGFVGAGITNGYLTTNYAITLINNESNSLFTYANGASNTVRGLIPTGTAANSNANAFIASLNGLGTNTMLNGVTNVSGLTNGGVVLNLSAVTNAGDLNNAGAFTNWGPVLGKQIAASRAVVTDANGVLTNAAGTPDGTKFLRDDNTYVTPSGGSSLTTNANQFLGIPLSIKSGALVTNLFNYNSLTVSNNALTTPPFSTHNSNSEQPVLLVNTNDRVGIRTNNPQAVLHVAGPSSGLSFLSEGRIQINSASGIYFDSTPSNQVGVYAGGLFLRSGSYGMLLTDVNVQLEAGQRLGWTDSALLGGTFDTAMYRKSAGIIGTTNIYVSGLLNVKDGITNSGGFTNVGPTVPMQVAANRVAGTDANGVLTNFPAGTAGQVLTSTGTGASWSNAAAGSGSQTNLMVQSNGVTIAMASTLNFTNGSGTTVLVTSNSGVAAISFNASGGSSITTNANQFLGIPLSIANNAPLTNPVVFYPQLLLSNYAGAASTSITNGASLSSNVSVYVFSSGFGLDQTLSLPTNANFFNGQCWDIMLGTEGTNILNLTPTNFSAATADKVYRSTNIVLVPGSSVRIQKQGTNFNIIAGLPTQPIGTIIPFDRSQTGICTNTGSFWVACNGGTLADPASPLNGRTIRNLNNNNYFVRGNTTSGGTGGAATHYHDGETDVSGSVYNVLDGVGDEVSAGQHTHTFQTDPANSLPPYMDMVWIMRVK